MWRTARESVTELKKKRKRNESNLDFIRSYSKRNLDSFYVPRSCFSLIVHAKPSGCFLKFDPKRRCKVNTYCYQGEAGPYIPLFFSPSQYFGLNDFNFPHRFEHFHFLFVKQVLKYCIYSYSNKRRGVYQIFSAPSAAFIPGWHLFESWTRLII